MSQFREREKQKISIKKMEGQHDFLQSKLGVKQHCSKELGSPFTF